MTMQRLAEYLAENNTTYTTIVHPTAYTASEVAELCHISGKKFAKTVMVRINGALAMAVVPANKKVDVFRLQDKTHANSVTLAKESDFDDVFADCELGAMPPFGNLFGMDVFVEEDLAGDSVISFNAGNHTELLSMAFEDYKNLVHPKVAEFVRD